MGKTNNKMETREQRALIKIANEMFGGYTQSQLENAGWVITDEVWQENQFSHYAGYHASLGIVVERDGNIVIEK